VPDWNIPQDERAWLRERARRQVEIAALPVMEERKKMWFAPNDGDPGTRPPVVIETRTFDRDFMPANVFCCQSPRGRGADIESLADTVSPYFNPLVKLAKNIVAGAVLFAAMGSPVAGFLANPCSPARRARKTDY
jgi:hypothetical protein